MNDIIHTNIQINELKRCKHWNVFGQ